jgi:hypothetical protein
MAMALRTGVREVEVSHKKIQFVKAIEGSSFFLLIIGKGF